MSRPVKSLPGALVPATLRLRPRLMGSLGAGLLAALLLPAGWDLATRSILGWNVAALLYCLLAWIMMLRADLGALKRRAAQQDEKAWVILAIIAAASLFSLVALFGVIHQAKADQGEIGLVRLGLGISTILFSWFLVHTVFAQHYAHAFYGEGDHSGGLDFPGDEPPDYGDFLYFSLVIGMTCQVSDVEVTNRSMRRLALAHGVLSFFFNTVVLAISVNLAAGLL